ncbi:MAG: hypothetical protein J6T06_10465 [Victivallales bacterium]|nr:hypothetical protein [Victivallales bacterium]
MSAASPPSLVCRRRPRRRWCVGGVPAVVGVSAASRRRWCSDGVLAVENTMSL